MAKKHLTDAEIAAILREPKPITMAGFRRLCSPRPVRRHRHRRASVAVEIDGTRKYQLHVRLHPDDPMNFAVRLTMPFGGKPINLIQCHGHQGPHKNHIEGNVIPRNTLHIHEITERYHRAKRLDPDGFATATSEYLSFKGAVEYMCQNWGVAITDNRIRTLPF